MFFILYGITGAMPFFAAVYLLLRRGNAFAPDVTPPVRLRRWAAAFFAVAALGHVWWYLFYIYSHDLQSAGYVLVVVLDCVALLTTIAGTLLAMLQDRKRPVWPAFAALIPLVALGGLQIIFPERSFMNIATIYVLSVYVLFSVYMVFAVRQYGRWLNDNYADLENKKVWLSQTVSLVCLLLFILYTLVDTDTVYILHVVELVLFTLLLWRVETLPQLEETPSQDTHSKTLPVREESEYPQGSNSTDEPSTPLTNREGQGGGSPRKLTYKEKRELEQLEKDIEALEAEKKQIEEALCGGTTSVDEITKLSKRLPQLNDELDEKSFRWLELSEIAS